MLINENALTALKSPVRTVEGRVYVYNTDGSTAYTLAKNTNLKEFTVERIGDNSKFFGYGLCHKANVKVVDTKRVVDINTSHNIYPYFINRVPTTESIFPYPYMKVSEVHRDENTNELSITCYDLLYKAQSHTVSELELEAPYTIGTFATTCAYFLGLNGADAINVPEDDTSAFWLEFPEGANFDGTETIREALDAIAEATQTIYYINKNNWLMFIRLDVNGDAVLTIDREDYITLETKTNRRLTTITHTTELDPEGIPKTTGEIGSTQYVRDNPFWEQRDREDIETLLSNAIDAVGGLTINQFECSWRGNYLLEPGDKIEFITKDDEIATSYVLDDVISYNGALSEQTRWSYESSEAESKNQPITLGEAVKQTYARVDRVNHEVVLVASKADANESAISAIKITTDDITNSVKGLADKTDTMNDNYEALYNEVQTKMSKDDYTIMINDVINENGVDKVITKAGFTFDDTGLTVDADDSEMKTQITEDGMKVFRKEEEVLTANNVGVNAINLTARNYLTIGKNSRIEDFGSDRTAIFWIGE